MERNKANFFTRLFARNTKEEAEVKVIDERSVPTTGKTLPHTLLALTPEQEETMPADLKQQLQQKLLELPPLVIGEVNIVPIESGYLYGGVYVKVFIRNGKEQTEISLNHITLYLVDANGEKVAGGVFRPANFGKLKYGESRYWTFAWKKEQTYTSSADLSAFTVAFE